MLTLPLLTAEQCAAVVALGAAAESRIASTERAYADTQRMIRVAMKSSLEFPEIPDWLRPIMQGAIDAAAEHHGYKQRPIIHECSYRCRPRVATYAVGQHFGPHVDVPDPALSFPPPEIEWLAVSLQLSATDEYEGGDLLIDEPGQPYPGHVASRTQGHATIFPAHRGHEVQPVTSGRRQALVFWANIPMHPNVSLDAARDFCDRNHLFGKDRTRVLAVATAH
jgi:predicted 2-oxoglutarate/Fe(II)-dependent dioxygenase YbiX